MKKRIFYLDFLRSFAIIMVIILHSINGYIVRPELYGKASWYINLALNPFTRTGVPIFLMISGSLILSSDRTKDFGYFYKKIVTRLVVPLVAWNILYFMFRWAMGYTVFDIGTLFASIINQGTEYHLWYLYTLIGIYLIAPFLKILVDNCSQKQQVLFLVLTLLSTTLCPFINATTPLYINLFEPLFNGYISLFVMGYILCNLKSKKSTAIIFSAIGILCFIFSVTYHHLTSSGERIQLYFNNGYSFCHYGLAASVLYIVKFLFEEKTFMKGISTTLAKYSFGMYLTHVAVIDLVMKFFMIDASPVLSSLYIFVIATFASFAISFVLSKIKYVKKIVL